MCRELGAAPQNVGVRSALDVQIADPWNWMQKSCAAAMAYNPDCRKPRREAGRERPGGAAGAVLARGVREGR